MNCPRCSSDNTQRLEVIFEQGTSHLDATSTTKVRPAFGGFATGKAKTRTTGVSMSRSAQKAAPPLKNRYKTPGIAVLIGIFMMGYSLHPFNTIFFLIGLVVGVIGGFLLYQAIHYNTKLWPAAYEGWTKSWMCNKCGSIFAGG